MGILSIVGTLLGPLTKLASEYITDKDKLNEFNFKLRDAVNQADKQQNAINQEEAKHSSIFVAGWRPAVAWICVTAMFFNYIAAPLIIWGTTIYGMPIYLPTLDFNEIAPILFGMLGLGGLRTVEKLKGLGKRMGK